MHPIIEVFRQHHNDVFVLVPKRPLFPACAPYGGRIEGDLGQVAERLERLRAAVARHTVWYDEHRISVTMTFGLAAYKEGQTAAEWINAADELLYRGKTTGKNKVVS